MDSFISTIVSEKKKKGCFNMTATNVFLLLNYISQVSLNNWIYRMITSNKMMRK